MPNHAPVTHQQQLISNDNYPITRPGLPHPRSMRQSGIDEANLRVPTPWALRTPSSMVLFVLLCYRYYTSHTLEGVLLVSFVLLAVLVTEVRISTLHSTPKDLLSLSNQREHLIVSWIRFSWGNYTLDMSIQMHREGLDIITLHPTPEHPSQAYYSSSNS